MRNAVVFGFGLTGVLLWVWATRDAAQGEAPVAAKPTVVAKGVVFDDKNKNGKRDEGEPGIPNVRVSNQREVVATNAAGEWSLPGNDDTIFFVMKPRGWMTPVDAHELPRFYYIHKPAGSPKQRFAGVAPTGALPASIDFALTQQNEPEKFRAIFFADPQPRDLKEINYIAHDVVEELIGFDAAFGVTLGDILFDDLSIFAQLNGTVALIGVPWYNVIGNHDMNYDSADDTTSDETYESFYGPNYYAFDYGPVHFVVLDDVVWKGATKVEDANGSAPAWKYDSGNYKAGLGKQQIEFVKNDLAGVPEKTLVVFLMHIPLTDVEDREDLYRLIEQRPFTMSVSGHTHTQEHRFITKENGWRGREPHHHVVNVTVSGSWWSGAPDEVGIPHTTMRDGAPNGYSIVTFDGARASFDFKAARRPADYQMEIYAPDELALADVAKTEIVVNIFAGSERSKVDMRWAGGEWKPMSHEIFNDPNYVRVVKSENESPHKGRKLPKVVPSTHLWKAKLPEIKDTGEHTIEVRTTDVFGHTYLGTRVVRLK
jgi:hypothetical protein